MAREVSAPGPRDTAASRRGTRDRPVGGTEAQAKEICLRLLTDRARSRSELETKLTERGFERAVISAVIDRLAAIKLVDDAEFAHQWVTSRHRYSGRGKRALDMELRTKGISPELAAIALETIGPDDERARASELVERKIRTLSRRRDLAGADRAERDKVVRSLVSMLARRGFTQGMAFSVVRAALEDR